MRRLDWIVTLFAAGGLAACDLGPASDTSDDAVTGFPRGAVATAAAPSRIDSNSAVFLNGGGCYPATLSTPPGIPQLTQVNPEWTPVVQDHSPLAPPVLFHGTAAESHISREDFPAGHISYDQNTELALDAEDQFRLATGNDEGLLELEWEIAFFPDWAWPAPGDRVIGLGRWIFDCGHADPVPGTCHGTPDPCLLDVDCAGGATCEGTVWNFRTELHPPQAVATIRSGQGAVLKHGDDGHDDDGEDDDDEGGRAVPVTRADIFVSANGGAAADACVVTHKNSLNEVIGAPCFPLRLPLALLPPDAPPFYSTDFSFEVPLPPVKKGGSPVWQVVDQPTPEIAGVAVRARLSVEPKLDDGRPRLLVTVHMTETVGGSPPTGLAATLVAGWRHNQNVHFEHVRVTLDGVVVHDARKPPGLAPGLPTPPGWHMQALVGGHWQNLQGLGTVDVGSEGTFFPIGAVFDQFLPRDGTLGLRVDGSSKACVETMLGRSLLDSLIAFGGDLNATQACLFTNDPGTGTASTSFAGPGFGARSTPYEIASTTGSCSLTRPQDCAVDADCPAGETCDGIGSYSLRFHIDKVSAED
jgi:hypothetical protein